MNGVVKSASLLTLLADAARTGSGAVVTPDGTEVPWSQVWAASGRAARALHRYAGHPIGFAPPFGWEYLAALVGALRAGADAMLVPGDHPVVAPATVLTDRMPIGDVPVDDPGGSSDRTPGRIGTGDADAPELVRMDSLGVSVRGLVQAIGLTGADVVCNPAPLDCPFTLCAGAMAAWVGAARLVLADPAAVGDPLAWPRACAWHKATIAVLDDETLVANGAALHDCTEDLDLSRLRVVLVRGRTGPVRAENLRAFNDSAMEFSFDEVALCPTAVAARGALVVSTVPPQALWRCRVVDPVALREGIWREILTEGQDVVSLGVPLPGVQVRAGRAGRGPEPDQVRDPVRVCWSGEPDRAEDDAATTWWSVGHTGWLCEDELHLAPADRAGIGAA